MHGRNGCINWVYPYFSIRVLRCRNFINCAFSLFCVSHLIISFVCCQVFEILQFLYILTIFLAYSPPLFLWKRLLYISNSVWRNATHLQFSHVSGSQVHRVFLFSTLTPLCGIFLVANTPVPSEIFLWRRTFLTHLCRFISHSVYLTRLIETLFTILHLHIKVVFICTYGILCGPVELLMNYLWVGFGTVLKPCSSSSVRDGWCPENLSPTAQLSFW